MKTFKKLRILLDTDDVLYQCSQFAIDLANQEYQFEPALTLSELNAWGKTGRRTDIIFKYFGFKEFYQNQPVIDGAKEMIRKLVEMGHEVIICTAVPNEFSDIRAKRLLSDFSELEKRNIIITERKDVCYADVMLDDAAHNITSSIVKFPVLFRRPWNNNLTGTLAINDYDEFLHLIKELSANETVEKSSDHKLICLIGPTGSGKTDIAKSLTNHPAFSLIKSVTTKASATDIYSVVSENVFTEMFDNKKFVETSTYAGDMYGINIDDVENIWERGKNAVTLMDISGVNKCKKAFGSNRVISLFIDKEKPDVIKNILERDVPTEEKLNRIVCLNDEYKGKVLCDGVILNKNTQYAVEQILNYIE